GSYAAGGSSPTQVPVIDANNPALTGLFYHGGMQVLYAQCIGSFIICASTFAVAMAVFGALNLVKLLRISEAGETEGMDLHEHGISAYPEYVVAPWAAPSGVPAELVNASSEVPRTATKPAGVGGTSMATH
ncbi:MAG TPA: hypothetical protein VFW23_11475, partial [Tepidisphaeraceae bacterium]|nr:hypothetical protein [Tepidisphaeraceae bacterium]